MQKNSAAVRRAAVSVAKSARLRVLVSASSLALRATRRECFHHDRAEQDRNERQDARQGHVERAPEVTLSEENDLSPGEGGAERHPHEGKDEGEFPHGQHPTKI